MCHIFILVLLCKSLSSFRCLSMMVIAGSIGIDVKSALTSYDKMHSGFILIFLILSRKSLLF